MSDDVKKEEEFKEEVSEAEAPEISASTETPPEDLAQEYLNDLKRLQAEFENYKKRQANEREEMARFVTNGVIADLVPVLDNFNMAVAHVPEDKKTDPWVTGITYIERQFEEVLGKYGVQVMEVNVGDSFDPTKHEAVEHHETEGAEKLSIEKVIQKGYLMGDRVIRAAKVTVTSA